MTKFIETQAPDNSVRETVEIRRPQFAEIFIKENDELIKGHLLREDGDRVTVRWKADESRERFVIKTVFREKFENWQREASRG